MSPQEEKYQPGEPPTHTTLPEHVVVSPDVTRANRLPPGQVRTRKWPVLHAGFVPQIATDQWRLDVLGLVEHPLSLSWADFQKLPRVTVFSDFHCVTRWSRLGNIWEGVSVRQLLERAGIKPEAKYVIPKAYDSAWTTNLPLADFLAEDALFADTHDGQPLNADHGGPVRLIVPRLYAWKSAKWIRSIELVANDRPGYWEQAGYHDHGDPWTEERFS